VSERGKFISLEGGEGVGKSTQLAALADALKARGIEVVLTREPGGSEGAEKIRELLLTGDDERWSAEAEALLFAAARADHVDKIIRPAVEAGKWVVSDRFVDSSLAYQGGAGKLGIEAVRAINAFGIGDWFPDRTLVLALAEGGARARERDNEGSDRIGGRPESYHQKVDLAFRQIAMEEPERVRIIDASGTSEQVTARLLVALEDLLP
jgi:dTMP kinase